MNIVSFWAPRPEHPLFQDYAPYLDLLRMSCERFGHRHVCLTDDAAVRDGYVVDLPRPLMRAFIAAQHAYLSDPANASTPTLLTGADCVLAQDPSLVSSRDADIIITVDDRFADCRMNMGAMWIPRPAAVAHVWADALANMDEEWGDDQRAVYAALERSDLRITELPCDPCNLAPDHPADDCRRGVVLHFRGPRKAWMADYCHKWLRIGDGVRLKLAANTDDTIGIGNIAENMKTPHEMVTLHAPHGGVAAIVGSGPSAADELPFIRQMAGAGAMVFALNGAARWLIANDVQPHFGVMLDMREANRRFVEGVTPSLGWFMASHCHPDVVAAASAVALFHHGAEEYRPHLPGGATIIGGGPTVGISAMYLACVLGFRRLHLFGYDSSFRDGQTHLLPQPVNEAEAVPMDVFAAGRWFHTNAAMYAQAGAFEPACGVLYGGMPDLEISVHGDGLLPAIAQQMIANTTAAEAA